MSILNLFKNPAQNEPQQCPLCNNTVPKESHEFEHFILEGARMIDTCGKCGDWFGETMEETKQTVEL